MQDVHWKMLENAIYIDNLRYCAGIWGFSAFVVEEQ
jgi:hypothetical protein